MPVNINADTVVGGAVITADTSGVLALQAAGSTQVTVANSGVTLATPLPVASGGTGATSLSAAGIPSASASTTFTGANTFRTTSGTRFEEASTQDAIIIDGRAGGTSSFAVTLTPATLSANRTLTAPDVSGTILTTGAAVTVAQGGTGATSLTANNVLLGNGTSALQVVAPGTTGNVLTSNGTTWTSAAAPAGGSWVFIKSVTASSSTTVDVEDNFNQYDMYAIIGTNISLSSGQEFSARIKIGGSYQTTNNYRTIVMYAGSSGGTPTGDTNTTYCPVVRGYIGASPESGSVVMYIPMPASTSLNKYFYFNAAGTTASTMGINIGACAWIPSTPVTTALQGIRFFISSSGSATITTGTFRLYGIKNS